MNEIKFAWDQATGDSTSAWLHTNVLLSDVTLLESSLEKSEKDVRGSDLLRASFKIHGVQDAWVDRYKMRVVRTQVVDWRSICQGIEECVTSYCQGKNLTPPEVSGSAARA